MTHKSLPAQFDLFPIVLPSGLAYSPDCMDCREEQALIAKINVAPLQPFRFQGWLGKRLTASFGWQYDFDNGGFTQADPIPEWLQPLRAQSACFSALPGDILVQALLTRYDPGAGIGWHRDRAVFEDVIGISLGAPAKLRLRRRTEQGFERHSLAVDPRSMYHLSAAARHDWEHSIAPTDHTRWSITFRSLSPAGPVKADQS